MSLAAINTSKFKCKRTTLVGNLNVIVQYISIKFKSLCIITMIVIGKYEIHFYSIVHKIIEEYFVCIIKWIHCGNCFQISNVSHVEIQVGTHTFSSYHYFVSCWKAILLSLTKNIHYNFVQLLYYTAQNNYGSK